MERNHKLKQLTPAKNTKLNHMLKVESAMKLLRAMVVRPIDDVMEYMDMYMAVPPSPPSTTFARPKDVDLPGTHDDIGTNSNNPDRGRIGWYELYTGERSSSVSRGERVSTCRKSKTPTRINEFKKNIRSVHHLIAHQ